MAAKPNWVGGTIDLVSGSKDFTIHDADLINGIAAQAGDKILHSSNLELRIASITDETNGKLLFPCPADCAGDGQDLIIAYQSDVSRYTAGVRQLISLDGNGNLAEFADLDGAADKLAYFTGAGTLDLAGLSAFARRLLDDVNGVAFYGTLGEIPNDQLPDRLQSTGAPIPDNDYNKALDSGFYAGSGTSSSNAPPGQAIYGTLLVIKRTSNYVSQLAVSVTTNNTWQRATLDGGETWSDWSAEYEAGSNSNGSYVRFSSGFQACWNDDVTFTAHSASAMHYDWTYPATFSSTGYASYLGSGAGSSYVDCSTSDIGTDYGATTLGLSSGSLGLFRSAGGSEFTVGSSARTGCVVFAIGWWN